MKYLTPNVVQLKQKFWINFLFCLFPLIAPDRLSYGLYITLCNMHCPQCYVHTVCFCLIIKTVKLYTKADFQKEQCKSLLVYKTINIWATWIHIRTTSKRTKLSLIFNTKPKSHHSTWFSYIISSLACFCSSYGA